MAELSKLMADGRLKARVHYYNGLSDAPGALRDLLMGKNNGKVIVKVEQGNPSAKL